MDRILRLGTPALALALLVGCGAQEDPAPTAKEPSSAPAVVEPSTTGNPNPGPAREAPGAPVPSATEPGPTSAEPKADAAPGLEGPKAEAVKFTDEELANIKKLPPAEAEAALKQAVCPVSGENLGMDVPIKVVAEGRTFYLCCGGCKDAVAEDPKGVVAKLDKK